MGDTDSTTRTATNRATPPWEWIAELFRSSARDASERKVGIEIERIAMWPDGSPFLYADHTVGGKRRPGAGTLLAELDKKHRWPVIKNDQGLPLGFASPFGKVSLEPGSQLELSTDPAPDLLRLIELVRQFESLVHEVTGTWGLKWVGIGVNPLNRVADIDVIPSTRYHIMTEYLGTKGHLGTSMMRLTSSIQVNLDYSSEAEGIEMLRVALAATPVSYALFGNSPLAEGRDTGYLSYRNLIWQDTDPDRTGLLEEAFAPGFNFSRYAEIAWHRPLMFAQDKGGHYVPTGGASLDSIGKDALPGVVIDDTNKINTVRELFLETRLKPGYIEVRSIDGLRPADRYAAAAFWTGMMYSKPARELVRRHLMGMSGAERRALHTAVAKQGLATKLGNQTIATVARELLHASREELQQRGYGEERLLAPLERNLEQGVSPAQKVLTAWHGPLQEQGPKLIEYLAEEGD